MADSAKGVLHSWFDDLERSGSSLLRLCPPPVIEQCFDHFAEGERPRQELEHSLAACPQEDLTEASRSLWRRASALRPATEQEARLQAMLLAFASCLEERSLSPAPAAPVRGGNGGPRSLTRPTELLRRATASLRAAGTVEAIGQALAESAAALCDGRGAVTWRREEGELVAGATVGPPLSPEHLRFRPTGRFWAEGIPHTDRVIELSPDVPEHAAFLARMEARRGAIVRLRGEHRWLGAVSVHDGDFREERLDLLAALAEQAAAAWEAGEAAQAREQAESASRAGGAHVISALATAPNLDELLGRVCTLAGTLTGADACCFFTADLEERVQLREAHGIAREGSAALSPDLESLAGRVGTAGARELLWLNQARLREAGYARLLAAGFRSALAVAFTARGQALGALVLLARSPSVFGARVRRELEAFSVQATAAVENMLLFENAQRRLTEMSDLTWVSGRVATTLDPDCIAQDIARAAANVLGVPRVAIFLADEEGQLVPLAKGQIGFEEARTDPLPASGHVGAEALASSSTRAIGDVGREGYATDPLVVWAEAASLLCAPMVAPQGLRGLLVVADDVPRAFDLHTVTLLSTYANQAALAFQSAVLYQHALQHVRRLTKLEELSEALAATEDPNQTAALTLTAATELLDAPVGLMWIRDPDEEELELKAVHGLEFEEWGMLHLKLGEDLAGRAAQYGRPQVSSDVTRDGRVAYRRQAREMGLGPAIAVPLTARGHTVGALGVYRLSTSRITDEDTRLTLSLANIAAVSIENANLAREAQRRSEFVSAMMSEVNYRMRNSLQSVAGLLRMELERPQARSAEEVVRRAIAHVQAVAAVHEVMREEDVPFVDMKEAATRVVRAASGLRRDPGVEIQVTGTRVLLPSRRAVSVALVLNELLDNALRHGLAGRSGGRISVSLAEVGGAVVFQVRDNGVGVPGKVLPEDGPGLGLKIVRGLVEQELGGTVEFEARNGFTARARFSKME